MDGECGRLLCAVNSDGRPLPATPTGPTLNLHREPLCKFPGKPVPSEAFPSGNVAADFGPKLMIVDARRMAEAYRSMFMVAAGLVVTAGALLLGLR